VIEELTREESEEFLRRQVVGRIGCHADGRTYVVPVIYVWDDGCAYVQSVDGRKIAMMRANAEVCFEVDEYEPDSGSWHSVIVEGTYEELDPTGAEKALALLVQRLGRSRDRDPRRSPRTPVAFRIRARSLSGRRVDRSRTMRALQSAGRMLGRRHAAIARRSDT
jgi:nitroimidazol reductase NimA-like FMN-containing flavoprotein (pyridoxamine 5'-phosphate oxidase superfamily)